MRRDHDAFTSHLCSTDTSFFWKIWLRCCLVIACVKALETIRKYRTGVDRHRGVSPYHFANASGTSVIAKAIPSAFYKLNYHIVLFTKLVVLSPCAVSLASECGRKIGSFMSDGRGILTTYKKKLEYDTHL